MSTQESQDDGPKARDGEIAKIPPLEVGDKVVVETVYNSDPNRTLTVEKYAEEDEKTEVEAIEFTEDGPQVILSGYGTTYQLVPSGSLTGNWQRIVLVWESRPEGIPVADIEVMA